MQDAPFADRATSSGSALGSTPSSMVSSADVNGTAVYSPTGDHLGQIDNLMIDKSSGQIAYAVMSFGGFLGIGHDHYPLPWSKLNYDEGLGGYRVDVTKEQVERAPHYECDAEYDWNRRNGKVIHDYYGVPPYWM